MNLNKEIKIKELPDLPDDPSKVLNSENNKKKILFRKKFIRDGNIQNGKGIIKNPIKVLIQFKEKLKIKVEGSKTENKLVIMIN
jgi:hypothetical protein